MGDSLTFTLPSGREIAVKPPLASDAEAVRRRLVEEYKTEQNGMTRAILETDDVLRRACLLSDSGGTGGALDPDPKRRCADWSLLDVNTFGVLWDALINPTREEAEAAREAAKVFRAGLRGGA